MNYTFAAVTIALLSVVAFAAPVRAAIKSQAVDYKQGDTDLKGYLVYDDAVQGKRPGVLVVHEWWGLNDYVKGRAEQLARLGYIAFAADMYGNGAKTEDPKEAGKMAGQVKGDRKLMRERATAGLEVLKKQSNVDPAHTAAIGYCFGGTTVLELARGGADVAGVVSFHGGLDLPNPADAKNIKCKILVCHGGNDTFVSDEELIAFRNQMRDANVDWQFISYGGAVHAFTNPAADSHKIKGIAYNKEADRRSWQAMKNFFDDIFK